MQLRGCAPSRSCEAVSEHDKAQPLTEREKLGAVKKAAIDPECCIGISLNNGSEISVMNGHSNNTLASTEYPSANP